MWLDRLAPGLALFGLCLGVAAAAHAEYPSDLLKNDTQFRRLYQSLVAREKESWLSKLKGPQSPIEHVTAGAQDDEYLLLDACKAHNCNTENVLILYSPKRGVAYAKVNRKGVYTVLGKPPADILLDLGRLFDARNK